MQNSNENAEQLIFGFREEWDHFRKQHGLFLERFDHLKLALDAAFLRTGHFSEAIDKFVFMFGRLCLEDFFEILLCCGNGYGHAGMKLLRGFYERLVTLRFLQDNPQFVDDFLDYHHVAQRKLLLSIRETMGSDVISEEMAAQVEASYREVKEKFMVTDCETCGTKRLNHTWNKLDFVAMAKRTGAIGELIVPGYYVPLRHAHSTVGSLLSRLEESDGGGVAFVPSAQRDAADQALMMAHNLILNVLDIEEERFKLPGLRDLIQICVEDYADILKSRRPLSGVEKPPA